jgi:hypothetical protein
MMPQTNKAQHTLANSKWCSTLYVGNSSSQFCSPLPCILRSVSADGVNTVMFTKRRVNLEEITWHALPNPYPVTDTYKIFVLYLDTHTYIYNLFLRDQRCNG